MSRIGEEYKRFWNNPDNFKTSGGLFSYTLNRKYKRGVLTPYDVGMLPVAGPKWWNKARHIRPKRRHWKNVEQTLSKDPEAWWYIELPMSNRKPHDYWW